ncbi:hypothetical protein PPACK8108_LOCUS26305 [Phakopsora pachyrhizi]|uniref:Uncharacterized protein n=1 Tax=Phakopsora pachyrhizi TaxID=170000 RepID=A0AAV0BUC9_PHAPC|nr:hypothetical protein PPACK8108_LOCUS26305 [Phakopsora pachyrhizi]
MWIMIWSLMTKVVKTAVGSHPSSLSDQTRSDKKFALALPDVVLQMPPPLKLIKTGKEMDSLPIPTLLGNRSGAQTPKMNNVNRILLTESQLREMINLKEPQHAHR